MTTLVRRLALNQLKSNTRNYKVPANFKPPTMDDMPVPQGSWQADYAAKQAKYNKQLAVGVGFAVFTLIVCKSSGLFFFNWSPPPLPGKE